jgi:epoxyqueuosine reductase
MTLTKEAWQRFEAECERLGLGLRRAAPVAHCGLPASPPATHAVVVAQTGGAFWEALRALRTVDRDLDLHTDPLDAFTTRMARRLRGLLGEACTGVSFPFGEGALNFLDLGPRLGFGRPSRMAILIHPQYGTWFAFRMLFWVNDAAGVLPVVSSAPESPCDTCAEAPCVAACPAEAFVGAPGAERLDYEASFRYRFQHENTCVDGCASRLACPVGRAHRYPDDFIREAQRRAMLSVRKHLETDGGGSFSSY